MGKGRVITAHGEGRYTIELLEDRARVEAARALAVDRVADLDARIAELEDDLAQAQSEVDAAADAQDQAIAAYQAAVDAGDAEVIATRRQAMTAASQAVVEAAAQRDAIAGHLRAMKVQRLAAQRRIDLIDALPPLRQQEAWCADYTEDLAGEVATAEVPGEVGQVLVRPAYAGAETDAWPAGIQGGAAWAPARDGAIQPALSGTPAGVFYHLAMLPGWQRWRPTFRIATITSLAGDLCDITLDAVTSSQQALDVNPQASYTGVPIYYMECGGSVFETGDRVLVAFSGNTNKPMVVGFESQPRLCGGDGMLDIQTAMAEFYGAAALSPMNINQPNDKNNRTTSLGDTYACGGTTYTEVLYEHTVVPRTEVIDYRQQEPFLYMEETGNLPGYSATAAEFPLSPTATSLAMQIAISYDVARSVTHTTTGSGGKDGNQWDDTCKPGYDTSRWFIVDTTYGATLSGQIEAAGVAVDWQRAVSEVLDYDSGGDFHSVTVSPYEWPIYDDFAADYSGSDILTVGGVNVDLQAVSAHYGWYWYSLQSLFLIGIIPEIRVSVAPSGTRCAVAVARFELSRIVHYVIGFEQVDGVWQRADGSMIGSFTSTRREAYEQATGNSYAEEFVYVPAAVG